ncbi:MAG: isoprenyl transferase [Firmicutes bacterium]|nr:isoprenyl transferase [Bacillota bacterium]
MSSVEEYNETYERKIPEHIAIIMDGNGRWATGRGMPRVAGHDAGIKALEKIVRACSEQGVKYLTVYAFSTENWKRPIEEVSGIFRLMVLGTKKYVKELKANNVKIQVLGDWEKIPDSAAKSMRYALDETKDNTGLILNVCLNYGSRAEITNAVRSLVRQYQDGKAGLPPVDDITEDIVHSYMYTAGMPDPDLMIRTGGEKRISNFLLWQCAYSEFVFSDVLWPDFDPEELMRCIDEFNGRHRRYGGLDKK